MIQNSKVYFHFIANTEFLLLLHNSKKTKTKVYIQIAENKRNEKQIDKKQHLINVQPIRSKEQLEDMKWSLKRHCSDYDYILSLIGINTGLRVNYLLKMENSEILKLK